MADGRDADGRALPVNRDCAPPGASQSDEKTLVDPDSPVWRRADGAAAPAAGHAPTAALPAGYRLHEYRIDAVLGQGGFGITYLATDVNLRARVAIKEYLPQEFAARGADDSVSARGPDCVEAYRRGLDNFLVEARTLATFRHPSIVRVARFFEANRTAYMVLEYERGQSLKAWWKTHDALGERDLLTLFLPLFDGLDAVHAAGYLHRDIKPDNILVRDDDGSLVLLDFGSARQTSAGAAEDNTVTPGYAPIEQYYFGAQGPWTDIYALGATLYWMIAGRKPVAAPDRMTGTDALFPAAQAGQGRYGEAFLKAVDWALAREAQERPRDMAHFVEALYAGHPAVRGLQPALRAGGAGALAPPQAHTTLKGRCMRLWRGMARPASWPLAARMTLAMCVTALAPMLITASYQLHGSIESVGRGEMRELQQLAAGIAGHVSQVVSDYATMARQLAGERDLIGFVAAPRVEERAALKDKLEHVLLSDPDVQFVMVFDRQDNPVIAGDPQGLGRDLSVRKRFPPAANGDPLVVGVAAGPVAGTSGVLFAHPLRGADNAIVGAVVVSVRNAYFEAIFDAQQRTSEYMMFLVDGDGVLLQHPDRSLLYASLAPLSAEQRARIAASGRYRGALDRDLRMPGLAAAMLASRAPGSIGYVSTLSGKEEIAGFAPVRGADWTVGVAEAREDYAAQLVDLFRRVLYSVVAVGAVFVGAALLFARTIVRPIEGLTRAADALKAGDYDGAAVTVKSNDEIGRLARTFNVMIDVLRQRERERGSARQRKVPPEQ